MATEQTSSHTREDVSHALNRACDDILEATEAGDEGLRDALNLMVNAAMEYLEDPETTLADVIEGNYEFEEGDGPLDWIARGTSTKIDPYVPTKASEVSEGDFIDLEGLGEPYVSAEDSEHVYQFEMAQVIEVEDVITGTERSIRVTFDSTCIEFPPGFELRRFPPEEES